MEYYEKLRKKLTDPNTKEIARSTIEGIVEKLASKIEARGACIIDIENMDILAFKTTHQIDEGWEKSVKGISRIIYKHTVSVGIGKVEEAIIKGENGWFVLVEKEGVGVVGLFSSKIDNIVLFVTATRNSAHELWNFIESS